MGNKDIVMSATLSEEDKLLDVFDDIEIYLRDLEKIRDAAVVLGNERLGYTLTNILTQVTMQTKKGSKIVKAIQKNK